VWRRRRKIEVQNKIGELEKSLNNAKATASKMARMEAALRLMNDEEERVGR